MKTNSTATQSYWFNQSQPQFPALTADSGSLTADVCIVGGGIAGLTTGYLLGRAGMRVVLLEDGEIGSGESGRSTAHITHALDDRYYALERLHGVAGARLAAQSHTAAIYQIEAHVNELQIDCGFQRVDGYLFAQTDQAQVELQSELAAAQRAGLSDVRQIERAPLEFDTGPCLLFPRQAQFDPLRYCSAMARAIAEQGGRIFTNTHVSEVEGGAAASVQTTAGAKIQAAAVVLATNTPINDRFVMHTKQAAYRTYAIGLEIAAGSVAPGLYWDTCDPYHYVRLARGNSSGSDVLIVGGEDHKTGQADDGALRFLRLEQWARERFRQAGAIACRWSGQVLEPMDGLAYIGRNPNDADNVYIATGDSGNGITHGTIAGMLLSDLITGRENPWATLYAPERKTLRALGKFAQENINVAGQYADWVTPAECSAEEDIPPDAGRIMRAGLDRIAVYRSAAGEVFRCHAACPHLGCVVAWNDTEKSWDCPCHGSRFDGRGRVIAGPSRVDLTPISPR